MNDITYIKKIFQRAEAGDIEALYEKGVLYDLGEQIPMDKAKASQIFKSAADLGHAHSAWIHAVELLWGLGTFPQSIENGMKYLNKAIEGNSGQACITKARLYMFGELGHEKDEIESLRYRKLAIEVDETVYDPLSNPEYVEGIRKQLANNT